MCTGGIARLITKRWEGGGGFGSKVELGVVCIAMKLNVIFKENIRDGVGID